MSTPNTGAVYLRDAERQCALAGRCLLEAHSPDLRHLRQGFRGCVASGFSRFDGESTTTAVLLEAIRARTSPTTIITTDTDLFFALASVVAQELYASPLPRVALSGADFAQLRAGDEGRITAGGAVIVSKHQVA